MNRIQAINNLKRIKPKKDMWAYNNIMEYLTQPTLDSNVEETIKDIEMLVRFKSNSYSDSLFRIVRTALSDKDRMINLLTKSHEDVVIELAVATERLNAIEEVVKSANFGVTKLDKIKQILEAQNE